MRYLPHTDEDIAAMLGVVGLKGLDDLFAAVPADCRFGGALDLPEAMSECQPEMAPQAMVTKSIGQSGNQALPATNPKP